MTVVPGRGARVAPKRKLVQWLATLVLLVIPFVQVAGAPLLRLDAGSRTLFVFGAGIRIVEFYLFLLAVLILVFLFLFVTMLFGRVWCGWLCPQTALCDLAEWLDLRIAALVKPAALAVALRQLAYLLIAALAACNLVWYFIAPRVFFARLFTGELGTLAGITLAATGSLIYLDLALVRRSFCRTVCPYGRIQLMTMEPGTLTLEFDPTRKGACLRCGACQRACPMGIDIRDGVQVECINCGRCLDACRDVMERRGGTGLIHYTFGSAHRGEHLLNRKAVLAAVIVLLSVLLAVGIATRREATLKVQRSANGEVKRLADGSLVNFYAAYLENRSGRPGSFSLEVGPLPGYRIVLAGPVRGLQLAANANRRVELALQITPAPPENRQLELRLVRDGKVMARSSLPLLTK